MLIVSELTAKQIKEMVIDQLKTDAPDAAEHIPLIKMMNGLSSVGFPLLVEAVHEILSDAEYDALMSDPVESVFHRVCSTVVGQKVEIAEQFGNLEEEHLFNQFGILLSDLETLLPFKSLSRFEALQETIWLAAGRWLVDKVKLEQDMRLRRILINISDELGHWLECDTDRFENEWTQLMAEHLRLACFAGGELHVLLPSNSNEAGRKQLMASLLLTDLRGLQRLSIDGREDVLAWISAYGGYADGPAKGLNELESIDIKALSDEQLRRVDLLQRSETPEQRRLFDLIKQGVSQRAIRDPKPDDLNLEPDSDAYLIAQHCRATITEDIAGEQFKFSYIPAGTFWMGNDRLRQKIKKPFCLGQTAVTQGQWEAVMGDNPSCFEGVDSNLPVEEVSWFDCVEFCNKLSELNAYEPFYRIGKGDQPEVGVNIGANGFRLPFEAEWEFAAKGGQNFKYAGSDNLDEVGWYIGNAEGETHEVAQKKPNGYGFYDMSGNVWEWCTDDYDNPGQHRLGASGRANRGGSCRGSADFCEVSFRFRDSPDYRLNRLGLRLSRSLA